VLVKKANNKWRVCVNYTNLNRACPKDSYPLPNIDKLVDNSAGYKLLSFMDVYSRYNQISMHEDDKDKTAFMTDKADYKYNVMSFDLKNTSVQRGNRGYVGGIYGRHDHKIHSTE
jgi:acyl-CoA-binding protein